MNISNRSYGYAAYGTGSAYNGTALAYCGEYRDRVSGQYLLGHGRRVYNSSLMRFHSPDSLSPFGQGGLNPYAYCMGDPINHVDRTGANPVRVSLIALSFLDSGLNVLDGFVSTLKTVVTSRIQGVPPRLSAQAKNYFKFNKGVLKAAASAMAWYEQDGFLPLAIKGSEITQANARGFSIFERLLNLKEDGQVVWAYLRDNPGQIGGVVKDAAGIVTGITPLKTAVANALRSIRQPREVDMESTSNPMRNLAANPGSNAFPNSRQRRRMSI
ncbi:RHS repeat-associated core domain-containing protein [Pseudomonas sp. UBA6562]|uniref:RHS repeat-associated core domain-containing protein n=1 Tax=Pseudomonas sp. UBA6562 TaxID=1947332 RepID=UPI0025D66F0E|nr:RHS repeat-associated core domain-containing protein [Pseudomonas sp. UBA6562]